MNNTARVYDFVDYKNKLELQNNRSNEVEIENELDAQKLLLEMMQEIKNLKQQIAENAPKPKKMKKRIKHDGNAIAIKENSKFCFKDHSQIELIEKTFIEYINKKDKYRQSRFKNWMYFIFSMNVALRVSDLRSLRFENIIKTMDLENNYIEFRDEIAVRNQDGILEKKTMNSHKTNRHIYLNDTVKKSVSLYLQNFKDVKLEDYMFQNKSTNSNGQNKSMSTQAVDYFLAKFDERSGLNLGITSHSLRRTWAWNYYINAGSTHDALLEIQIILGHTDILTTMRYIGITKDMISDGYKNNNIGMKFEYEF